MVETEGSFRLRRSGRRKSSSARTDVNTSRARSRSRRFEQALERLRSEEDSLPSPAELDPSDFAAYRELTDSPPRAPLAPGEVDRLRQENRNMKRLQEVIHFLGNATELDALVPEIVGLGVSIAGLSRGLLALLGSKSASGERAFTVRVVRGIGREERSSPEVRILRKILARTLEERRPFFEADARNLADDSREGRDLALGAVVALPLEAVLSHGASSETELVGALLLDDPARRTPFTPHEVELLRSFARHASLALARLGDRRRLSRRTSRLRDERERFRQEGDQLRASLEETQNELIELRSKSGRVIAAASSRIAVANGGREPDRLDEFLGRSWAAAKRTFLKRYLKEALRRAHGDLERAALATGLNVAKLVKLLDLHEVQPQRPPVRSGRDED
jgi:hypothetical protein